MSQNINMKSNKCYHQNENETFHYPSQVEPSSRTLIFDTKNCFRPELKH